MAYEGWFSPSQVAKSMNTEVRRVQEMCITGKLKATKVPFGKHGRWWIDPAQFNDDFKAQAGQASDKIEAPLQTHPKKSKANWIGIQQARKMMGGVSEGAIRARIVTGEIVAEKARFGKQWRWYIDPASLKQSPVRIYSAERDVTSRGPFPPKTPEEMKDGASSYSANKTSEDELVIPADAIPESLASALELVRLGWKITSFTAKIEINSGE